MFSPICDDDLHWPISFGSEPSDGTGLGALDFRFPKSRTHPNRSITHWYQFPTEIDDGWWFAEIRHEAVPGLWSCDGNIPWFVKETSFMDPQKTVQHSQQLGKFHGKKTRSFMIFLACRVFGKEEDGFAPWKPWIKRCETAWGHIKPFKAARHLCIARNPGCKSTRTASWICWAAWNSRWWQAIRSQCWPRRLGSLGISRVDWQFDVENQPQVDSIFLGKPWVFHIYFSLP